MGEAFAETYSCLEQYYHTEYYLQPYNFNNNVQQIMPGTQSSISQNAQMLTYFAALVACRRFGQQEHSTGVVDGLPEISSVDILDRLSYPFLPWLLQPVNQSFQTWVQQKHDWYRRPQSSITVKY